VSRHEVHTLHHHFLRPGGIAGAELRVHHRHGHAHERQRARLCRHHRLAAGRTGKEGKVAMYKLITLKDDFLHRPGDTIFQPRLGRFHDCLMALRLMLGPDATLKEAVNAGYRIVRAS
jgi:hypothetical protein